MERIGSEGTTSVQDSALVYNAIEQALQQLIDLLKSLPNDDIYNKPSTMMPNSTIGKHARHLYDHFNLLVLQIQKPQQDTKWLVDYDERARNGALEHHRNVAILAFRELGARVQQTKHTVPFHTPVTLSAIIDPSNPVKFHFESSFGRELWYCCMHAIHHFAAMKAICIENQIQVPPNFGMAPSTVRFRQRSNI